MKQMIKNFSLTSAVIFSLLLLFAVPTMAQHGPGIMTLFRTTTLLYNLFIKIAAG